MSRFARVEMYLEICINYHTDFGHYRGVVVQYRLIKLKIILNKVTLPLVLNRHVILEKTLENLIINDV